MRQGSWLQPGGNCGTRRTIGALFCRRGGNFGTRLYSTRDVFAVPFRVSSTAGDTPQKVGRSLPRAILQKRPWSCPLTASCSAGSWRTIEEMASLAGIRRESDRASSCRGGWQMRSHTERCPLSRRRLRASGGSASRRDCIPRGMYSRCLSASPRRRVVRASSWQDLESQKYVSLALQTVSADTPQKVGRHVVVGERRDHHRSVAYDDPQS